MPYYEDEMSWSDILLVYGVPAACLGSSVVLIALTFFIGWD